MTPVVPRQSDSAGDPQQPHEDRRHMIRRRALTLLIIVLLIGVPAALTGLADLNEGWGTIFFFPGGLFELILPFVLFVKGFSIDPQRLR